MRRYNKLLAGASWMAEYGDPDTDDWKNFLSVYSAYHNIHPTDAPTVYPHLLMMTSMKDDRVHPYHARSFIQRLIDLRNEGIELGLDVGDEKVYYYENVEGYYHHYHLIIIITIIIIVIIIGGHGGAADNKQMAYRNVLKFDFLFKTVGKKLIQ